MSSLKDAVITFTSLIICPSPQEAFPVHLAVDYTGSLCENEHGNQASRILAIGWRCWLASPGTGTTGYWPLVILGLLEILRELNESIALAVAFGSGVRSM